MAIVGVTVSASGESLQRLAITTKVAIGEVVKTQNGTRPNKLDHFIFLRKGIKLEWEPDPELVKHFGESCREVSIILLDDELENVFRTEYAWWSATEKKCWGDGAKATRRTQEAPDGQEWEPCGDTCPELEKNVCKPSGDLYFILADYPRLGAVCRLHTTSYRSVRQIHSALEQIRTVTGGRLAGIRCQLVVRPEKTAYFDAKKDKKVPTTIYALNIELSAQGMHGLIAKMTENAKLFEQTKKLLGAGRKVEFEEEPEPERAPDVAQEFYPAEDIAPAVQQPARASAAATVEPEAPHANGNGHQSEVISGAQRREFIRIAMDTGWNQQQIKELLSVHFGFEGTAQITVEKFPVVCEAFSHAEWQYRAPKPYEPSDADIPF